MRKSGGSRRSGSGRGDSRGNPACRGLLPALPGRLSDVLRTEGELAMSARAAATMDTALRRGEEAPAPAELPSTTLCVRECVSSCKVSSTGSCADARALRDTEGLRRRVGVMEGEWPDRGLSGAAPGVLAPPPDASESTPPLPDLRMLAPVMLFCPLDSPASDPWLTLPPMKLPAPTGESRNEAAFAGEPPLPEPPSDCCSSCWRCCHCCRRC